MVEEADPLRQKVCESRLKYSRLGTQSFSIRRLQDKKLKTLVRRHREKAKAAVDRAAEIELFLTEEPGFLEAEHLEKTWKITQDVLCDHVDLNTRNNIFTVDLKDFGPYRIDYTRNGRNVLIGGRKGHVASFDWNTKKLFSEFHVRESVWDVKWLQNETMYAVAQKKYTFIYDKTGMELHCLRQHIEAQVLEYLQYHWLLASVGNPGVLIYHDISTGNVVSEIRTKMGPTNLMSQNPNNAVLHMGHSNGTVTLWSPSVSTPLVKILCHKGPVKGLGVDKGGRYMATVGMDKQLKLWDIRTFKILYQYYTPTPGSSVSISDRGLVGVGFGPYVHVWKDAHVKAQSEPYMSYLQPSSRVEDLHFVPFEDVLGIGHEGGISSISIPGSGDPNYDTIESNPYQTKKQRQEAEIHGLLDKIMPEMIVLDPDSIAKVDSGHRSKLAEIAKLSWEANNSTKFTPKNKARGRNSSANKARRKKISVIDMKFIGIKKKREAEREKKLNPKSRASNEERPSIFSRFEKKLY